MSAIATAIVASSVIGGSSAKSAAGTQADAANRAADLQYKQWQEQQELMKPWLTAGEGALNRLSTGLAAGGEFATPFEQTDWQQDPGYAFRMSEGLKALDRQAAARGGLISGGALKAAQRYGQDLGSQEYQNAFNRYYTSRTNMLQPLQSLAGVGQTAANTVGAAGQTAASNIGNALTSGAAASAAGQMGMANALSGGVSQYLNYTGQNNLLNALRQTPSTYYTPSTNYNVGADYTLGSNARLGGA